MGNSPDYKRSRIVMTLGGEESPGAGGRGGCVVRLPGMPGFGNYVQAGGSDSAPAAVGVGCRHLALLPGVGGGVCHPLGLCSTSRAPSEAAGEEPEFSGSVLLCCSGNH